MIQNIESEPFNYANFSCKKGDSFTKIIEVTNDDDSNFNFTGYAAKVELRKKEGVAAVETFSTSDGSIVLESGLITISKDAITGASGSYKFDLQITKEGKNTTILTGDFTIKPDYSI